MKKILIFFFAITAISFVSCSKVDDREQFVGTYSVDATGSATAYAYGESLTIPFDASNEPMTITKSSNNETEVIVSGFFNGTAIVVGNSIQFESFSETATEQGMTMVVDFNVRKGSLNGNVLTFRIDVSGNIYYEGSTFPLSGSISSIATKQN